VWTRPADRPKAQAERMVLRLHVRGRNGVAKAENVKRWMLALRSHAERDMQAELLQQTHSSREKA
jgi:hypothetical protein